VTGMGGNAGGPSQGVVRENVLRERRWGQRRAVPGVGAQAGKQGVGCGQGWATWRGRCWLADDSSQTGRKIGGF